MTHAGDPSDATTPSTALPDGATRSVDVADGIDRVMGDRKLYARMLARFRNDYGQGMGPIRSAISYGDLALAQRLAHTLKGASGMIGAHPLHMRAAAVEQAIRTRSGQLEQALTSLGDALADVLQVLGRLDHEGLGLATPSAPVQRSASGNELTHLQRLLENGDGAALDALDECYGNLLAVLGQARLAQLAHAVNDFDFAGALRLLGEHAAKP